MQDAINYAWNKGLVLVAAAGNIGPCANCIKFPARGANMVAAGATDPNDALASFSSTGSQLDVVAPGVSILTTVNGGSYGTGSGTSFSSPHTAGLATLIMVVNPSFTNQQVVDIITSTADDLGTPGRDDQYGWGRINACKALASAKGLDIAATCPPPSPTPTPTTSSTPTPTPTSTPTTNSVVISNISSTTTANSATVKWTTNIPATSRVEYGTTTSLGQTTPEDTSLTTNHSVTISGLTKQTRYYFKVFSKNSAGLETSSTTQQFRTKNK